MLKNKVQSFLIIMISGLLFVSCQTSFVGMKIENARPGKEELSPEIQSLTLLNRSLSEQFVNHNEDSLQAYFFRNGYQLSKIVLDSLAADTTIQALAALLFESGRYDVVVPVNRNIPRNESYEQVPEKLSLDQINQYCSDYKTDGLIVLERFTTKIIADHSKEKYNDPFAGISYYLYASLDIKYNAVFRVYQANRPDVLKDFVLNDTIYWENADNTLSQLFAGMPTVKAALINTGIKVALDLDSKLSPLWMRENRGYFIFRKENDPGHLAMQKNDFAEAESYWIDLAQTKNKKNRSKAEYNLALISELKGDLDGAIQWGLKSFYTYYRNQTETYLKKLEARKLLLGKQNKMP